MLPHSAITRSGFEWSDWPIELLGIIKCEDGPCARGVFADHGDEWAESGSEPGWGLCSDAPDTDGWEVGRPVLTFARLAGDHEREKEESMNPLIDDDGGSIDEGCNGRGQRADRERESVEN